MPVSISKSAQDPEYEYQEYAESSLIFKSLASCPAPWQHHWPELQAPALIWEHVTTLSTIAGASVVFSARLVKYYSKCVNLELLTCTLHFSIVALL